MSGGNNKKSKQNHLEIRIIDCGDCISHQQEIAAVPRHNNDKDKSNGANKESKEEEHAIAGSFEKFAIYSMDSQPPEFFRLATGGGGKR